MNLEKTLLNYGLTEKQAKTYLACLELGSASVAKISQKAGLARSTCYEVLESLMKAGLAASFRKKKVKYFSAEDPKKAINLTKERAKVLEDALPEFQAIFGQAKTRPTVRFYQGKQEMKNITDEILQDKPRELLSFGSISDLMATLEFWPKFVERRAKLKIPVKIIAWDSQKVRERQRSGPQHLREIRIVPDKYQHHGTAFIWKNKIAMFSFQKDLTALVIESEELVQIQKASFNYSWDTLAE